MAKTKKSTAKKPAKKAVPKKSPAKNVRAKKSVITNKASPAKKARPKKREDLNCFLTTACVSYYGLADKGYILNTLRGFRDNYMMKNESGSSMVDQYYKNAPKIVEAISVSKLGEEIYQYIYSVVIKAVREIEKGELAKAEQSYSEMYKKLHKKLLR